MSKELPTEINLTADSEFYISDELADNLSETISDYLMEKFGKNATAYGYEIKLTDIMWED